MKEAIIRATENDIYGTGLSGYLRATTNAIVKVFGKPHTEGSIDGKTRFEWHLKLVMEDGDTVVFTIYDWKDKTPFEKVNDWHVGCHDRDIKAVRSLLENTVRNAKVEVSGRG